MTILKLNGLCSGYGANNVLHDVSLSMEEGECVAVLGANGAGKSTLLRAISGLLRSTGGIQFQGRSIARLSPTVIARAGVAHVPEGRGTIKSLTVEENLRVGSFANTGRREEADDIARCYELFPILKERRSWQATSLSGGEQQMLAIGRALMARPRLVLLDEPSFGLAPKIVDLVYGVVVHLVKERRLTVLLVEQVADLALSVAHRAYVLRNGAVVAHDTAAAIRSGPTLHEAYLGAGASSVQPHPSM